jgi:hypothetical protein
MFDESEYELFSVSTAVFVAGSLVPVAALLAALVSVPGGWLSLATILAVVALPVTVGLVRTAVEEDDVARFVGGDNVRGVVVFAVPAVLLLVTAWIVFGAGQLGGERPDEFGAFVGLAPLWIGTALTFLGGLGMAHASECLYTRRLVADSDVRISLGESIPKFSSAKWDRRARRLPQVFGVIALVAGAGLFLYELYVDGQFQPLIVFVILGGLSGLWNGVGDEYELLEARLRRGSAMIPLERFDSFEVTEEYLVLHRGRFTGGLRFERETLSEEEERVIAVLEEALPREEE